MNILNSLFLFSGRLKRSSFALAFFSWLALVIGLFSVMVAKEFHEGFFILIPLGIWVGLSIIVCRLRDAGTNVYLSLLLFVVGFFLILYCLIAPSKNEEVSGNRFEETPKTIVWDQSESREKGFWKFLIDFSGRISRKTYLLSLVGHVATFVVLLGLLIALDVPKKESSTVIVLLLLFQGLSLSSLTVRRAHDIGRTTRWVIFNIISVIGSIIVFFMCLVLKSDSNKNEYGVPADQAEESRPARKVSPGRFDRE